jgi:hypothetical protein
MMYVVKGDIDDQVAFHEKVGVAMDELGYMSTLNELSSAQTKLLDSRLSLIEATTDAKKELWEVAVEYAAANVKTIEAKMKQLE